MMLRTFSTIFVWAGLAMIASAADDKRPAESLDDQLLKGLSKDAPDELKDLPKAKPTAPQPPAGKPRSNVDDELFKRLTEGEDIGESGNPLVRIGNKMKKVEGLLGEGKPSPATQDLQQQIVTDLDTMIKEMRRQKQKSSSSSASAGSQRGKPSQPDRNPQPGSGDTNNNRPQESSEKLQNRDAQPVDMAEMKKLLQNLWGDLPAHEREQLLNASGEQFLPKYQLLIEKYFRRLGEGETGRP